MSQNLHQFFQITDMISRLERQFFLPRYIIKHLVHTHSFGSCHIILPTIAYHQRITHLGLCGRKGKMKNFGPGLQDTDVIRENNLLKKVVNACRTHLMTLQLLEAVGKDIEVIFPRQIFQHLISGISRFFVGMTEKKSSEKASAKATSLAPTASRGYRKRWRFNSSLLTCPLPYSSHSSTLRC